MIAATYETEGPDANVLVIRELPDPVPGAGEVLVRVAVSGVNPTDWKTRMIGDPTRLSGTIVPNQDGSGTITAIGDGVDPGRVGERVWLYDAQWERHHGTAAQLITLPSVRAVPLADSVSFDLGAGLGIPYMTAHRCLFADGLLAPGTPVLVHGGAGAVGHAAIELARWAGARVATTVSSAEKKRLAREAGAELVVNYRTEDVVAAVRDWMPDGVARIVEVNLPT
ncbi:MAG: zinc-binding dehydrogenase, partial [Actinomycetota bacterium]|nr:zinc-binding dehydrogenase [Actinomycetota bacterium]